ncbi:c-type cytochrome [Roseofilum sp. SID2]|uniref:c-type cytochrome n=1 Tax=Roseofilum sp. SID2 TaxID=2821498 RepID=UPI0039A3251E
MIVFVVVGLGLLGFALQYLDRPDPYLREVLALEGDRVQGHAIFQMNCAGCHGLEANGRVGPSLKGVSEHRSKRRLIEQVITGRTPPMPQFQPSPEVMADLLSYLESL